MAYDLNEYKDLNDYGLVDKGKYEAVVEKIEIKTASTGTVYLNIQYRIRSDVDQPYGNRVIFETIFKEKDSDYFNRQRLTKLVKATCENSDLYFESIDDILESIAGKKLIINVAIRHDEFRDADINYVSYYEPPEAGDKVLETTATGQPVEKLADGFYRTKTVIDDDLPF